MNLSKEQFVDICKKCGYADKERAMEYAEGRDNFTDDDLMKVYRMIQREKDYTNGCGRFIPRKGYRTTKRYKHTERLGSDRNE